MTPEERCLLRGLKDGRPDSLQGWYPVSMREEKIWWRHLGEKRFCEPFFFDSLRGAEGGCVETGYQALAEFETFLPPAAFVFHLSRSGSTLFTQLFSVLESCSVLSEPTVIDYFLREHYARGLDASVLRGLVGALAQKRFAGERHFLMKLDSWHIASLPLFRQAFPKVPFFFVYRTPGEVLASHERERGRQMVPGLVNRTMPGFDYSDVPPWDFTLYTEKVMSYFLAQALQYRDELILLNYRQFPQIVWTGLAQFLRIETSEEELARVKSKSRFHSKGRGEFRNDPEAPGATACDAYYRELEKLRLERGLLGG